MGREIRMVPPNWEHPTQPCKHSPWSGGCDYAKTHGGRCLQPQYDHTFAEAAADWKAAFSKWEAGDRPDYCSDDSKDLEYWEYNGDPPEREYYRSYESADATWVQVYETVSEGTPVTPPFATKEELIEFLCTQKDFWGQGPRTREVATAFVNEGYVPSMVISGGVIYEDMQSVAARTLVTSEAAIESTQ